MPLLMLLSLFIQLKNPIKIPVNITGIFFGLIT